MTMRGESGQVAAVIGDGALTGGMANEGLNNIGKSGENIIIVLNDNEMAISRNDGALARYLSVIRSKPGYFKAKDLTDAALRGIPVVGEPLRNVVAESKTALKQAIYPHHLCSGLGFTYFGPSTATNKIVPTHIRRRRSSTAPLHPRRDVKGKDTLADRIPESPRASRALTSRPSAAILLRDNYSTVHGKELTALAHSRFSHLRRHGRWARHDCSTSRGRSKPPTVLLRRIAEQFGVTFRAAMSAGNAARFRGLFDFLQRVTTSCCTMPPRTGIWS
jgi:1-deoxy-D-xylulose-5-phosphate synthase